MSQSGDAQKDESAPVMFVFAGPNGSGKSSINAQVLKKSCCRAANCMQARSRAAAQVWRVRTSLSGDRAIAASWVVWTASAAPDALSVCLQGAGCTWCAPPAAGGT